MGISSSLRTAWVPLACMALGGLALLLERRWGIGGLVPLGGLALPWLGEVQLGSRLLAMAVSVGVIALSLRSGAALLACDALGQNADPTDARRAAGRYAPEAALLFLLALAGGSVALVPIGAGAALRLLSGQLCFQLLPALLAPALLGLPAREALSLRAPPRRAWIAAPAVLAGTMSAGLLAMSLQIALLPDDPFSMLDYGGAVGELQAGWGVLCLTLGAGLCEELLFRGAIFGLLRRSGPSTRVAVAALIWQAVAFSLLHVLSFKLIPTGVIGLILGVLAWRTGSVWPGVVVHAAHNATALLGAERLPEVFNPGMWGVEGHIAAAALSLVGVAAAWWAGSGEARGAPPHP